MQENLNDCQYLNRPISPNSIPTAANGLINPDAPIRIFAFRDKVSFGFLIDESTDWNDDVMIRVFDDKGKLLGTLRGSDVVDKNYHYHDGEKVVEIFATGNAKNYYVEFSYDKSNQFWISQKLNAPNAAFGFGIGIPLPVPSVPSPRITVPDGSSKTKKSKTSSSSSSQKSSKSKSKNEDRVYCYVLFSVSTFEPDLLPEEVKEVENVVRKYMRENGKSSYSELELVDEYSIHDELREYFWENKTGFFSNVSDFRNTLSRMSMSEINKMSMNYLTKNKISRIEDMTDSQIIALEASMIEGQYTGRPEYSALIKKFKAKYGITSYENMTINQLNRLQHEIAKEVNAISAKYQKQQNQTKQTKPASSKPKSSSSRKKKSK